ncbi:hypothetical protein BaRGS_00004563 [Batillaria attramentaria]|uniref:Uncharacterized protein n=1 Tax=Batillaria attramentaria TaxID=370345 RepID=A0ABD0LX92_9CAEN
MTASRQTTTNTARKQAVADGYLSICPHRPKYMKVSLKATAFNLLNRSSVHRKTYSLSVLKGFPPLCNFSNGSYKQRIRPWLPWDTKTVGMNWIHDTLTSTPLCPQLRVLHVHYLVISEEEDRCCVY